LYFKIQFYDFLVVYREKSVCFKVPVAIKNLKDKPVDLYNAYTQEKLAHCKFQMQSWELCCLIHHELGHSPSYLNASVLPNSSSEMAAIKFASPLCNKSYLL